ncbi:MAG: putative quinol monooxygenase [Ilumatobacter sp.]|uniref:putative quinol monooxygenase n=1 Tax=Ilumatobacter sp. TaxID=1967498 RepID=UPI00391A0F81
MATMLAHVTIKSGMEERWETICRRLYAATHASEPAMRRYEYWRGSAPRSYYVHLSFDDHRAFIVHQVSDHHETESPHIGQCLESFRLEFVDPVSGASDLAPTDAQDAPADADELTRSYTERFAAQVADWWLALR